MVDETRREFFRTVGASATAAAGLGLISTVATAQASDGGFEVVEVPTSAALNSVVETAEGPFAVGGGGDVIARRESGWQKVVEFGPQARSRRLTGADVTARGKAIWFVGGSGVIGEYRVDTETLTNYSAPKGKTSTWEDCAVAGTAGVDERLYFVNGSGELLVGVRQDNGAIEYNEVIKPGGGSTIPGIDLFAYRRGHVCSTSQLVAQTNNGGESFSRIGIDFAGEAFNDVASVSPRDVNVAAGNGIVYRYDGFRWTPHVIDGDRQPILGIDRDGDEGLASGSSGKVFERRSAGQWTRYETDTGKALNDASRGDVYDVAVGNSGTVVERESTDTATAEGSGTDGSAATLSDEKLTVEERKEGKWVY